VPASFLFVALGPQIAVLLFAYHNVSVGQAYNIGYMLMAFGLGLIPFSAQYLLLRGFYAFEDTKTPFTLNVWISAVYGLGSLACYYVLPARWAVVGMAAMYAIGYAVGLQLTARKLSRKLHGIDGRRVWRTYVRLCFAALIAAIPTYLIGQAVTAGIGQGRISSALGLAAGGAAFAGIFLLIARKMRLDEVDAMLATVRGRLRK